MSGSTIRGSVQEWKDDEGWGILVAPDLPGTVFAHHVQIRGQFGYRGLESGEAVLFAVRQPGQDGCDYTADWVERISEP